MRNSRRTQLLRKEWSPRSILLRGIGGNIVMRLPVRDHEENCEEDLKKSTPVIDVSLGEKSVSQICLHAGAREQNVGIRNTWR